MRTSTPLLLSTVLATVAWAQQREAFRKKPPVRNTFAGDKASKGEYSVRGTGKGRV